jgi:hypothetical protein
MNPKVTAVLITREKRYPTDIRFNFPFDETLIKTSCQNVNDRYDMALQARNDLIYFQDDDAEIDILRLWSQYNGRITNVISPWHRNFYHQTGITLVGWGAFFPKEFIDFTPWTRVYGALPHQEADRVFTFLNQPHNSILLPIRKIERNTSLWKRPNHAQILQGIIHQLHALPIPIIC